MNDPLATINGNKIICTGMELGDAVQPDMSPTRPNENAFITLVSEYYQFFRESNAPDIAFLLSIDRHRLVVDFDNAIYLLRTAKQHNDNQGAVNFYNTWVASHASWQDASSALAQLLNQVLAQLAQISLRVRRDPKLVKAWKDRASTEPQTVFEAVCQDLKVGFRDGTRKALIGNVVRRAKYLRPHDDIRACLEDFCAQEITAQGRSLPVPYHQVLDRLGVLGTSKARAALLLAYSISASTRLQGENFLVRVEQTWLLASS